MYDVQFDADGNIMRMNIDTGILVSTIDGMTGVSSSFNTVQAISNIGVSVTGGNIAGKNLTVSGIVLDGNTFAKQLLLDFFKPMRKMTMYFNSRTKSSLSERYRKAEVYVKTSPVIKQDVHSQFSIVLFMPSSFFEAGNPTTIEFTSGESSSVSADIPVTILGDTKPSYTFTFTAAADCYGVSLYDKTGGTFNEYLYLSFIKLPNQKIESGDIVKVWRDSEGHMKATVNGNSAIVILYTDSTLWRLPLGNRSFWISADHIGWSASVEYTALYAGVLNDDV